MIRTILSLFTVAAILGGVYANPPQPDSAAPQRAVFVIPVDGNVTPALGSFISRAMHRGKGDTSAVYVLEMDTYGGEVDAAFRIVDTLVALRGGTTIAYVKTKAISAGALIALACDSMYMRKSTTIGDVAPLTMAEGGPKMLGEKYQSPIRAKFRTLAKRNGYSEPLAESMVTEDLVVYRLEFPDTVIYLDSTARAELPSERAKQIVHVETVVRRGELLTMDDVEAQALGFSRSSVDDFDDFLGRANLAGCRVERIERNWSERFVGFIAIVAPILMMIGFAALYTEMRTPGFGLPGIIGIVCLGIVFSSQYLVGLADYTELLLFITGLILLAMEIFVLPGFGIAGVAGIVAIMAAMVLSFQGFVLPRPDFPWEGRKFVQNLIYAGSSLIGSIVLILLFFRFVFPRLGMVVSGPYLSAALDSTSASYNGDTVVTVGNRGEAYTSLRPSGKALFDGDVYDVISQGIFIEKGDPLRIIEVEGNRIVVVKEDA